MGMFKKIKQTIKLKFFNKTNKTKVKSLAVSLKANISKHVSIEKNSFVDENCDIGKYTFIGKNCNITKTKIGSYSSIANGVSIGQGEHDLNKISTSSIFYNSPYDELTKGECVIGNDVWIGSDAIILRGVRVGDGAVIGANAVVTKDVAEFEVVVGVPAKHLKYRFDKEKIEKIKLSQWWEEDYEKASEIILELEKTPS